MKSLTRYQRVLLLIAGLLTLLLVLFLETGIEFSNGGLGKVLSKPHLHESNTQRIAR